MNWTKFVHAVEMDRKSPYFEMIPASYARQKLFIGTVFKNVENETFLLTPDIDFINLEYDTIDLAETPIKPILNSRRLKE